MSVRNPKTKRKIETSKATYRKLLYQLIQDDTQTSFVVYSGDNPELVIQGLVNDNPNRYLYINRGKVTVF